MTDNATPYKGPFGNDDKGLDSIQCIDQSNIEFHLVHPIGDFGYTVSVSTFAPVKVGSPSAQQGRVQLRPDSNGPYKVVAGSAKTANFDGTESLTDLALVRNRFWSPTTDPVRKAYPDKIVLKSTNRATRAHQ